MACSPFPGSAEPTQSVGGPSFTNFTRVSDVAATSYGLLAVGNESVEFWNAGVLWRSLDGHAWERLELGAEVNTATFTGEAGPGLRAVAEREGRVVMIGENGKTYFSDDLDSWLRGGQLDVDRDLCFPAWSATAGPDGFVVIACGAAWFSPDGETWESVGGDDQIELIDVIFDDERFVTAGGDLFAAAGDFAASEDEVAASVEDQDDGAVVWTSNDGRAWQHQALPSAVGSEGSRATAVAALDDVLIVAGSTWDGGPAVWRSNDDGHTWTHVELGAPPSAARDVGIAVTTATEFVLVTFDYRPSDDSMTEYRSADGIEWDEYTLSHPGQRIAATSFEGGAVAVGQADWPEWFDTSGTIPPPSTADDVTYPPALYTVSVWTLGLPPPGEV